MKRMKKRKVIMTLTGAWKTQIQSNKITVANQRPITECSYETWTKEKVSLSLRQQLKPPAVSLVLALANVLNDLYKHRF